MPRDLAQAMPEWQFQEFQRYAAQKLLPHRRLEFTLARIAASIAQFGGDASASAQDYLFDIDRDDPGDAAAFFQFNPRPQRSE